MEEGQNRRKVQKLVDGGEEDRISALPDGLILEILNRLPTTEDAIRTGALSKRWKHNWTSVTTLTFKNSEDVRPQSLKNPNARSDFVSFVDKTLAQCRRLKLKKFVVDTSYDSRFQSQVNSWIHYAISCNVEELELMFSYSSGESGGVFLFDQSFFISSCFTDLTLRGCELNPTGAISWKNLRRLCFSHLRLDEALIDNILSGSPLLETLELVICCGFSRLDISSKSVKNLVVCGYADPTCTFGEDTVEINAPNILSLTIQNNVLLRKLLLLNVSSLVEAYLDYKKYGRWDATDEETEDEMLKGFLLSLRHVKDLKIGQCCSEVLARLDAKGFAFPSIINFCGDNFVWYESGSESESEHESYNESEGESENDSERESGSDSDGEGA